MANILAGKVAFISGASRGIGKAIAERFAAEGAKLVLNASRIGPHADLPGTLQSAVDDINAAYASGTDIAVAIPCNLSDREARADLMAKAAEPFGPIDILVNNAAAGVHNLPSLITTKDRDWVYDLNVHAPMEFAAQALPAMREKGSGWILNISSATAEQPIVPYRDSQIAAHVIASYGASKAALNRETEGLAHELYGSGVYVNTLSPESICLTAGPSEAVLEIGRKNPDMVESVEVMAEAALLLCSDTYVGEIGYSRRLLHSRGLAVKSLDGKTVIGDAFMTPDLNF